MRWTRRPGLGALLASLLLTGCAMTGTRPDDMSAAEHEAHARVAGERAEAHDQAVRRPYAARDPQTNTDRLLAESYRLDAELHASAADALRRFQAQECAGIQPEARSQCPLVRIARVEQAPEGAILWLAPEAELIETAALIRCHMAFARARHYEGMDDCPLYLRGLSVAQYGESAALLITSEDPEVRSRLFERLHVMTSER